MMNITLPTVSISLVTIYQSFVRPNLDYAGVIYKTPHKGCFIEDRAGAI